MKKIICIIVEIETAKDTSDAEIANNFFTETNDLMQGLKDMHHLYIQFPERYMLNPKDGEYEYKYDDFFHRKVLNVKLLSTSVSDVEG